MFDINIFRQQLKDHPEEIMAVMDSERQSILQTPTLKILRSAYLVKFWEERPNKQLTFILYIKEDAIESLDFEKIKAALSSDVPQELKKHRWIEVSSEFSILASSAKEITQDLIIELSKKRYILFYFGAGGVDPVIKGEIFNRVNIFYDDSLQYKYSKKFSIAEIDQCLEEYESYINSPGINQAFFASLNMVNKLSPKNPPKNTLHNKPEIMLRDNLEYFLTNRTQHTFVKEVELDNKGELDLFTEVETKKYLIEVKWLGQSINDDETGFTQKVTDYSARDGVIQALEYIKHLIEDRKVNFHTGFLCVFDVRDVAPDINYKNFDFITDDLAIYYKHHFRKLKEVRLTRKG